MKMLEPQVTKNTLKDLYTIMDNKQTMQVLSNSIEAKEIIHYLNDYAIKLIIRRKMYDR